jgi:curved DNA-binding protein CbpA/ketosteroid isomerase-like protein
MKDYYEILGVEEEASEEEIRARWVELTKHYHPDLGKTEEGEERIREINEAYEILKDESTRFQYDFERDLKRSFVKKAHRQQERRMNIRKTIVIPSGILVLFLIVGFILFRRSEVASPPKTEAFYKTDKGSKEKTASQIPFAKTDSKAHSLPPQRSPSEVERESERKKEPPRKILPESKPKLAPQAVVKSEMPAMKGVSKEVPREIPKQAAKQVSKEVRKEVLKEVPKEAPGEIAKEVPKEVRKEVSKEVATEAPKEIPREVSREIPKEAPKEIPGVISKEVPKEVRKEVPKEAPKEAPGEAPGEAPKELPKQPPKEVVKEVPKQVPTEVPKEIPKELPKQPPKEVVKEVPKEPPKEVPKDPIRVTLHPGEKLTMWTKEEKAVPSRFPLLAKEEEVKQFFSDYVDRYHRKDVGGFLSFFSSKAIQNQTEGSEAISNLYTKFFNQSEELRYQIEGMRTEIYQNRIEVKARFRIDQKLKKDGEEKVWKGNIRWVLVKEEGRLKILSLDYQNEKSS